MWDRGLKSQGGLPPLKSQLQFLIILNSFVCYVIFSVVDVLHQQYHYDNLWTRNSNIFMLFFDVARWDYNVFQFITLLEQNCNPIPIMSRFLKFKTLSFLKKVFFWQCQYQTLDFNIEYLHYRFSLHVLETTVSLKGHLCSLKDKISLCVCVCAHICACVCFSHQKLKQNISNAVLC